MAQEYKCPKCGGSDYFMSIKNVMKGIGGIYGNRGGTKEFPVCKVCDEIMLRIAPAWIPKAEQQRVVENQEIKSLNKFNRVFRIVVAFTIIASAIIAIEFLAR